jgi:hypothetical protein
MESKRKQNCFDTRSNHSGSAMGRVTTTHAAVHVAGSSVHIHHLMVDNLIPSNQGDTEFPQFSRHA